VDYLELSLAVLPEAVEAAADTLRRHVPSGVSIEPVTRALDEDGGVEIDASALVRLRAWLPATPAARAAIAALRVDLRVIDHGAARPLRTRLVHDEAWADAWKRHFGVQRIGKRLVIRPSWRRYRARKVDVVIDLDPGMAFGTGQHPTTRMCLEELESRLPPGATVLDVGCGSGILSIAAALLGATRVDAIDLDPAAVAATRENAARNGVERIVRVAKGSLGSEWPLRSRAAGRYDIVLANLSSRLIRELAEPLVEALAAGGVLLASGLIAEQEQACREALHAAGGGITKKRSMQGWRLLVASGPETATSATDRTPRTSTARDRHSRR
jgi:ribosomal protein L11 methyltransferase